MLTLKPIFQNLKEVKNMLIFKEEWSDKEYKTVNQALRRLFTMKTLTDHRGNKKTMYTLKDIEDFFGLPYTSSSSYAMIGNTNTIYHIDIEENYNITHFAIATDNRIILIAEDNEENEKYYVID